MDLLVKRALWSKLLSFQHDAALSTALQAMANDFDSDKQALDLFNLNATQRLTLESILKAGELPRARLAEICGVSAPAMTKIVRELMDRELIKTAGKGNNPRGQPTTNLMLNPEGGYGIGVFIERDALTINLINFRGEVCVAIRQPGRYDDPRQTMNALAVQLDEVIATGVNDQRRIIGLGVAVTGNFVIDGHSVVPPSDMAAWQDLDMQALFRTRYPFNVIIENDASSAALGEMLTGQGKKYSSFFYIHMANGLGGGYIFNNRLIRGAHGNASEIGHMLPEPKTRPTLRNLSSALGVEFGSLGYEEIRGMFLASEPWFMKWLDKAIANLQSVVNALAIILDPEAIVFGGRFPTEVIDYMIEHVKLKAYGKYWAAVERPVLVPAAKYSADAAVYGAATLPLYAMLSTES